MPKRTNPFQQTIATVYAQLSETPLTESALVPDERLDTDREVDIRITETVAGEEITVGIETTTTGRKYGLTAVQGLIRKHEKIGTSHLVIVSRSGFTGHALREIEDTPNVSGYEPKDLTDKPGLESKIVGQLAAIWQKRFSVTITDIFVYFDLPERLQCTHIVDLVPAPPDFPLINDKLQEIASPGAIFAEWANADPERLAEHLDIKSIAENTKKTLLKDDLAPPWLIDGKQVDDLYIMIDTRTDPAEKLTPEPLRVKRLDVRGPAEIAVTKVDLKHQRLNDRIAYSVGEAEIDGEPILVVASYTKKGEKLTTLPLAATKPTQPAKRKATKPKRKRKPKP